jgi:hypothetical protein
MQPEQHKPSSDAPPPPRPHQIKPTFRFISVGEQPGFPRPPPTSEHVWQRYGRLAHGACGGRPLALHPFVQAWQVVVVAARGVGLGVVCKQVRACMRACMIRRTAGTELMWAQATEEQDKRMHALG